MITVRARAVAALVLIVVVAGCRCGGQGCHGKTPTPSETPFAWGPERTLDEVPADGMAASLLGSPMTVGHVQLVEEADGSVRLEISDRPPQTACGPVPDGQGFSLKLPGPASADTSLDKSMTEHPDGVSAFMIQRLEDGTTRSVMTGAFSVKLTVTELERSQGLVAGRIALMFDDADHSGAAGTFVGELCPP